MEKSKELLNRLPDTRTRIYFPPSLLPRLAPVVKLIHVYYYFGFHLKKQPLCGKFSGFTTTEIRFSRKGSDFQ